MEAIRKNKLEAVKMMIDHQPNINLDEQINGTTYRIEIEKIDKMKDMIFGSRKAEEVAPVPKKPHKRSTYQKDPSSPTPDSLRKRLGNNQISSLPAISPQNGFSNSR